MPWPRTSQGSSAYSRSDGSARERVSTVPALPYGANADADNDPERGWMILDQAHGGAPVRPHTRVSTDLKAHSGRTSRLTFPARSW
jgi:hypothetical protein